MTDRSEPTWENQLWHAERVYQEQGDHALMNPHGATGKICGCNKCFCCAAYTVHQQWKERHQIWRHGS